jgi:ABC-type glutathione transport system ATPase component
MKPSAGELVFEGQKIANLGGADFRRSRLLQFILQDAMDRSTRARALARSSGKVSTPRASSMVHVSSWSAKCSIELGCDGGQCSGRPASVHRDRRARVLQPKPVVADERVAALDFSIRSQVLKLQIELKRGLQLTCVFVSHNLAAVNHVSDRIVVIYLGKLVELIG